MIGTLLVIMLLILIPLSITFSIYTMFYINKRRCGKDTKSDFWLMVGFGLAFGLTFLIVLITFLIYMWKYIRCHYLLQKYKKHVEERQRKMLNDIMEKDRQILENVKDKLLLEQVYIQTLKGGLSLQEEIELSKIASRNRDRMTKNLNVLKEKSYQGSLSEEEVIDLKNIEILLEESRTKGNIIKSDDEMGKIEEQKTIDLATILKDESFSEIVKLIEDKDTTSEDYKFVDLIEDVKTDRYIGYLMVREDDDNYLENFITSLFRGTDDVKVVKYDIFKSLSLNAIGYKKNDDSTLQKLIQNFEINNAI